MMPSRLALAALLALAATSASARDERLVAEMAALDRAYIDPLFFTSSQNLPKTTQALDAFAAAVAAADRAAIPALGAALKQRFVPVYTAFAADPALNRLP